jgi:hypothetical protein
MLGKVVYVPREQSRKRDGGLSHFVTVYRVSECERPCDPFGDSAKISCSIDELPNSEKEISDIHVFRFRSHTVHSPLTLRI